MSGGDSDPLRPLAVGVWGTGNMGRAAIRAVVGNPHMELAAVLSSSAERIGTVLEGGITVESSGHVVGRSAGLDAIVYVASGDVRPDAAADDIMLALRSGADVVSSSLYSMYDPRNAPAQLTDRFRAACEDGGSSLFVSGVDPGWANDVLPLLLSGLATDIAEIRCMEIFDYSTYDASSSVRDLVGMGMDMSVTPPMVFPSVPTMVWGGQLRMMARGLGYSLDRISEHVERRPLERSVDTPLGRFEAGTQGALRFEIWGHIGERCPLVIEHVTRIHPEVAPDWPAPATGHAGEHRVTIDGEPSIEVTLRATAEGGNHASGGNATAANRLVSALPWLAAAPPGVYDALDIELPWGAGRLRRDDQHNDQHADRDGSGPSEQGSD